MRTFHDECDTVRYIGSLGYLNTILEHTAASNQLLAPVEDMPQLPACSIGPTALSITARVSKCHVTKLHK